MPVGPKGQEQIDLQAAELLGADRHTLPYQDRLLRDTQDARLAVARLIPLHRPAMVYAATAAAIHPDHVAAADITRAAVFLARLGQWERVPGGEALAATARSPHRPLGRA